MPILFPSLFFSLSLSSSLQIFGSIETTSNPNKQKIRYRKKP